MFIHELEIANLSLKATITQQADALEHAQQRIAELEAEIASAFNLLGETRQSLAIRVEQMREALNELANRLGPRWCLENNYADHLDALTLSTQPAAEVIKAHDAKVIERCAEVADECGYGCGAAIAIRALIAAPAYTPQAAKVSETGKA